MGLHTFLMGHTANGVGGVRLRQTNNVYAHAYAQRIVQST